MAAATDIPDSDIKWRRRRPWRVLGIVSAIALVLAGWSFVEWRQERVLDDGPRVQAEVVDTDYRRRRADVVIVRYEVEGQRYQQQLPAETGGMEPGDRIEIIYDPANPRHARPVQGWSPTFQLLWLTALFVALGAIGL